jgi:hypothetical protein
VANGQCGVCGRPTESKWNYCSRPGRCNAARQRAIREAKSRGDSELIVQATQLIADALERELR